MPESGAAMGHPITSLLHDAMLHHGEWQESQRTLRLRFTCLRRAPAGGEVEDRFVVVQLTGVTAIAAVYDTAPGVPPSRLQLADHVRMASLDPWPMRPGEPEVLVDWAIVDEDLDVAARVDWLFGGGAAARAAAHRFCLASTSTDDPSRMLVIACEDIQPWTAGRPLSFETWHEEAIAWSRQWVVGVAPDEDDDLDHDDEPDEDDHADDCSCTFAPPGPPFAVGETDMPADLLATIRAWFETLAAKDWIGHARVQHHPDVPVEDGAAQAEAFGAGQWAVAHRIESWWIEGRRAGVTVKGVTYSDSLSDEGVTRRDEEWSFALRRREGAWNVHSYVSVPAED